MSGYGRLRLPARLVSLVLLAALIAAACTTDATTPGPSASPSAAPSGASASPSTSAEPSADASLTPSASPSVEPAPTPTTLATAEPSPLASGEATPGPAAACSGSADNRTFYASFAAGVPWDVYCAVLPAGWYLAAGTYRLAGIGRLEAAYHGPGGMRLSLLEGAFCTDTPEACAPSDSVIGPATLGDRDGQLVNLASDLVLYVDPGLQPAWQVTGTGMTEEAFRAICAAFVKVGA